MNALVTIIALAFSLSALAAEKNTVVVKFTNLGAEGGQIALAVFSDPDSFPDKASKAVISKFFPLDRGVKEISLSIELPPGTFALTAFQDKNGNKKLDKNLMGAPTERFGFSRNPKIGFSAPNFSECSFEVTTLKNQSISVGMKKLF